MRPVEAGELPTWQRACPPPIAANTRPVPSNARRVACPTMPPPRLRTAPASRRAPHRGRGQQCAGADVGAGRAALQHQDTRRAHAAGGARGGPRHVRPLQPVRVHACVRRHVPVWPRAHPCICMGHCSGGGLSGAQGSMGLAHVPRPRQRYRLQGPGHRDSGAPPFSVCCCYKTLACTQPHKISPFSTSCPSASCSCLAATAPAPPRTPSWRMCCSCPRAVRARCSRSCASRRRPDTCSR